jgi:hypothetical protein
MDEAHQDHPASVSIFADRFGGLQKMFYLREIGIRIAVVDKRVEVFGGLPNAFLAARESEVLLLFAQDVIKGLPLVIDTVELGYRRIRVGIILAVLGFRFSLS